MSSKENESIQLLQGTLDLIVLRTLSSMGSQHAYQIASRLEQVSDRLLNLNQARSTQRWSVSNSMGGSKVPGEKRKTTATRNTTQLPEPARRL